MNLFAPQGAPVHATMYSDGGSRGNPGPAAFGWVLYDKNGEETARGGEAIGDATNNVAEYRGVVAGVRAAAAAGVTHLLVRLDSDLIVKQMRGEYKVKHPAMKPLHAAVQNELLAFAEVTWVHVRREKNKVADAIVNAVLDGEFRG